MLRRPYEALLHSLSSTPLSAQSVNQFIFILHSTQGHFYESSTNEFIFS